ncbi:hypothetical protein XBP1_2700005 [Xenorhabdus bovienii str. puntauvense]|uniref:Uncharacterized protein n=1 Tax=Xenorhabdus bovienii str. puntauvense TaxID=1398201 RepID=A0A077NIF4_XENBV|nr:hypothetical protein XBP1_2700005 [Xenorhabdus bovienii str. puntauvense]
MMGYFRHFVNIIYLLFNTYIEIVSLFVSFDRTLSARDSSLKHSSINAS